MEGMPLRDSCSAMTCKVLVFPVPVAPAIKPCLFNIFKGIETTSPSTGTLSNTATPIGLFKPLLLYPFCIISLN